jgi:hypothetical protein
MMISVDEALLARWGRTSSRPLPSADRGLIAPGAGIIRSTQGRPGTSGTAPG